MRTYKPVILIAVAALVILAYLSLSNNSTGVYTGQHSVSSTCTFSKEFECLNATIYSNTGSLNFTIQQVTSSNMTITAYGCNNKGTFTNMITPSNRTVLMQNKVISFNVNCYQNTSRLNIVQGQPFKGYVMINYTNSSGTYTATGTITAKAV